MKKLNLSAISNVGQYFDEEGDPHIVFQYFGYKLELVVVLDDDTGIFEPLYADHDYKNNENSCPFCGKVQEKDEENLCMRITEENKAELEQLFHSLIQHNSIRLHWLFVDYEGKEKCL